MPDDIKAGSPSQDSGQASATEDKTEDGDKRRRIRPVFVVAFLVFVVAVYFGAVEIHNRLNFIHEEDARINADLVTVSSRVAGWITEMPTIEGDRVQVGTVMVQIDDRESLLILSELESEIAGIVAERSRLASERALVSNQLETQADSQRARVAAANVSVQSLKPQLELAERELSRAKQLFADKVSSRRALDQAETQHQQLDREYRIAVANLQSARAQLAEVQADQARLTVMDADLAVLERRLDQTKVRMERQRLDMVDRSIKSPIAGIVDRTFVDVGEYVTPGQRLALVHDPEKIWVEANVKETVVRRLSVGQSVNVHVDAYPDESFTGTVQTIGSAATSQFALLPTPNPSGNFTKITQRLPVRIAIDNTDPRLRPGMMVEVEIEIKE